ncbi:hypothetical protein HMPREF3201_02265 [Megasphaera sp. MJR8396C]|nr:hypothetical protein HMPREF3201_02265 [Megasphaera sp. MJR8396C]
MTCTAPFAVWIYKTQKNLFIFKIIYTNPNPPSFVKDFAA